MNCETKPFKHSLRSLGMMQFGAPLCPRGSEGDLKMGDMSPSLNSPKPPPFQSVDVSAECSKFLE